MGETGPMPDLTLHGGVGSQVTAEIDVKRSRFLCRLVRVETEDAARAAIDAARSEHWAARHHCSAIVVGPNGSPDQVRRSNDDGEPSGTAGRPMLEALSGRGLVDIAGDDAERLGAVVAQVTAGSGHLEGMGHEWVDVER
jgi:hypothetical protein